MDRKKLPLLSSFLRFDRKCSELGSPLITKAGSAPETPSKLYIWRGGLRIFDIDPQLNYIIYKNAFEVY